MPLGDAEQVLVVVDEALFCLLESGDGDEAGERCGVEGVGVLVVEIPEGALAGDAFERGNFENQSAARRGGGVQESAERRQVSDVLKRVPTDHDLGRWLVAHGGEQPSLEPHAIGRLTNAGRVRRVVPDTAVGALSG